MKSGWIGRLLSNVHAGEHRLLVAKPEIAAIPSILAVSSSAFPEHGPIPSVYAGPGVGENKSPPLVIRGAPVGAQELVITLEDPDAPLPRPWIHLLAYGIPGTTQMLPTGALNAGAPSLVFGKNTGGASGYSGPRAIPGHGPHRYWFNVFALGTRSRLPPRASLAQVQQVLITNAIARGQLVGLFERGQS